jgi:kynureninase
VAPRLHDVLEPQVTGWMAHDAPFAFEPELRYAAGIARFLHGSPSVPALYAARSGYRIINEIGIDRIRANSTRMTTRLIELADAAGLRVTSPLDPQQRGGTVTIDVSEGAAVVAELARRDVLVDFRPGAGIRVSPHFYTRDDELERAIDEIADIVRTGAFDRSVAGAAY